LKALRTLLFTLTFILLFSSASFAAVNINEDNLPDTGNSSITFQRKNPFLAGAFSWFHPGLGQFYVGESKKAITFWLTENILLFAVVLNIADIKIGIKKDFGFDFAIKLKKNPSTTRLITTVGMGLLLIAIHIYNVIDAINSAQAYNQKIFEREFGTAYKPFSVEACAYRDVNGFQLVGRF
jgi:TM2 domain-containing membrane protein YozV